MHLLRSAAHRIIVSALFFPVAGCGGGSDAEPPTSGPTPAPSPDRFWVEPGTNVTIGGGQVINIYAVLQKPSDPYPRYQASSDVSWTSSEPGVASIDSDGLVTGLTEGVTTVTASRPGASASLVVTVDGTMESRVIGVAGQGLRRYAIYTPSALNAAAPAPLIVSAHGGGGSPFIQAATTQLNTLAHQQRVHVVYFEGSGAIPTFNAGACCGFAQSQNVDDVAYARAVLDDAQSRLNIDTAEINATGFSNGGMLSYRLACAISDRIARIAAVGGGSGQFDFDRNSYYACNPTRPIPVLHIHATNDRNYPFAGGFGDGVSTTNYYPIEATIENWIARNNVTATATLERVTATTECRHYREIADDTKPSAAVTLCIVDPPDVYDPVTEIVFGGGHSWPGGVRSPAAASDTPPTDFSANEYLWNFFSANPVTAR